MTSLKVAVIGAGSWGRNHVRTLAALPEVELVAVCDLRDDRREAIRRQYPGVTVTGRSADALGLADAVVVATPSGSHAHLVQEALDHRLPVLVEKPFALSVRDAEALAELADRQQVPVVVGHLLLFHPAIERLKAMMDGGDLGDVYYLSSRRINRGPIQPDENVLWSFGPHDVSVALYLLNQVPTRVMAQGRSFRQPGIEDVVFMVMDFAWGPMAQVQMSWLDPHKERRLTVVGSHRMVVFDDMQVREKLKIYDKGIQRPPEYASYGESLAIREGDISIPRVAPVEPLSVELRHFIDVARGSETPRSDGADGVRVVRVLEAATRSLAEGGAPITCVSGHAA